MNSKNDRTLPLLFFVTTLGAAGFYFQIRSEGTVPSPRATLSPLLDGRPLNVNKATAAELSRIPKISENIAQEIVALRASKGRFNSLDELGDVRGIGPKILLSLQNQATLE